MSRGAKLLPFAIACAIAIGCSTSVSAEVEVRAHYSLKGAGGVRDTAPPEVWKSLVPSGPDLARQGSPRVMTSAPECRRDEYDSSIKFEAPDQCYNIAKNLVGGDDFVVEAWALALEGKDDGLHAVVANGHLQSFSHP